MHISSRRPARRLAVVVTAAALLGTVLTVAPAAASPTSGSLLSSGIVAEHLPRVSYNRPSLVGPEFSTHDLAPKPTGTLSLRTTSGEVLESKQIRGKDSLPLPTSRVGTFTLELHYGGDEAWAPSYDRFTYTVTKARATTTYKIVKAPSTRSRGQALVRVRAAWSTPGGTVRVLLKKKGQKSRKSTARTLRDGSVVINLPTFPVKGSWTIQARYPGSSVLKPDNTRVHALKVIR